MIIDIFCFFIENDRAFQTDACIQTLLNISLVSIAIRYGKSVLLSFSIIVLTFVHYPKVYLVTHVRPTRSFRRIFLRHLDALKGISSRL